MRIASAAECASLFGYPPGVLPPFGHPPALGVEVLLDSRLMGGNWTDGLQQGGIAGEAAQLGLSAEGPASAATGLLGAQPTGTDDAEVVSAIDASDELLDNADSTAASRLVYCGAGVPDAVVALTRDQLLRLSAGRLADIAQDEDATADAFAAYGAAAAMQSAGATSSDCVAAASQPKPGQVRRK